MCFVLVFYLFAVVRYTWSYGVVYMKQQDKVDLVFWLFALWILYAIYEFAKAWQ